MLRAMLRPCGVFAGMEPLMLPLARRRVVPPAASLFLRVPAWSLAGGYSFPVVATAVLRVACCGLWSKRSHSLTAPPLARGLVSVTLTRVRLLRC